MSLPRMADFALWAMACETTLSPAGTFALAYDANRRAAVEAIIEGDPVAVCVQGLIAERGSWVGTASDFLRAATCLAGAGIRRRTADWPRHPGALAGRLRRAQTFLHMLGIEVSFSREGHAGTRTIRISSELRADSRASALSASSAPLTNRYGAEKQPQKNGIEQARERC